MITEIIEYNKPYKLQTILEIKKKIIFLEDKKEKIEKQIESIKKTRDNLDPILDSLWSLHIRRLQDNIDFLKTMVKNYEAKSY